MKRTKFIVVFLIMALALSGGLAYKKSMPAPAAVNMLMLAEKIFDTAKPDAKQLEQAKAAIMASIQQTAKAFKDSATEGVQTADVNVKDKVNITVALAVDTKASVPKGFVKIDDLSKQLDMLVAVQETGAETKKTSPTGVFKIVENIGIQYGDAKSIKDSFEERFIITRQVEQYLIAVKDIIHDQEKLIAQAKNFDEIILPISLAGETDEDNAVLLFIGKDNKVSNVAIAVTKPEQITFDVVIKDIDKLGRFVSRQLNPIASEYKKFGIPVINWLTELKQQSMKLSPTGTTVSIPVGKNGVSVSLDKVTLTGTERRGLSNIRGALARHPNGISATTLKYLAEPFESVLPIGSGPNDLRAAEVTSKNKQVLIVLNQTYNGLPEKFFAPKASPTGTGISIDNMPLRVDRVLMDKLLTEPVTMTRNAQELADELLRLNAPALADIVSRFRNDTAMLGYEVAVSRLLNKYVDYKTTAVAVLSGYESKAYLLIATPAEQPADKDVMPLAVLLKRTGEDSAETIPVKPALAYIQSLNRALASAELYTTGRILGQYERYLIAQSTKASPTGTAYVQIGPADLKLLSEVSTTAEAISTSSWDYVQLQKKFELVQPAGVVLANVPANEDVKERMEEIKEQTENILYSEALQPLSVEAGNIVTDRIELVQDMGDGTEIEYVPISPTQAILMQQPQGTYVPVAADTIVNEVVKRTQADRRAMLIDFDALGYLHKRADGSIAFIPNDKAIRAISILNNINGLKASDNKQRYYISVYSNRYSLEQMKSYLGALAVPFADGFINTPTVAEAISTIIQEQKIAPENIAVALSEATADNPNVLGKLAENLAKAVKFVMVKTPAPGANFASYKAMLITTLRLLEGTLSQQEIERLRHDIEIAPGIRPLAIEPESDKKEVEAISNMQAAIKA